MARRQGLTLDSRAHSITDAGSYVPGFSSFGSERVNSSSTALRLAAERQRSRRSQPGQRGVSSDVPRKHARDPRAVHVGYRSRVDRADGRRRASGTGTKSGSCGISSTVPHHCSTLPSAPKRAKTTTKPTADVNGFVRHKVSERHTMIPTSNSMPDQGQRRRQRRSTPASSGRRLLQGGRPATDGPSK